MKAFIENSFLARELKKLARESQGKPLSIMNDVVFKAMLSADNEDSREALRSLLSACTRRKVSAVKILNNDLVPLHLKAKASRLDVHVTFNDGEKANLEMQARSSDDDLRKRSEYYTSMLVAGQMPKGKLYKDIKAVYQIFFVNDILFPASGKFPQRYYYQEETERTRLSGTSEIIFYELPKLERRFADFQAGKIDISNLTEEEKWCIYMRYRHKESAESVIMRLCQKEEGIMRAEKAVTKLSRDEVRYARRVARMKDEYDRAMLYNSVVRQIEGEVRRKIEDGVQKKERERNSSEIARNALSKGLTPELVHEITGLDLETIKDLRS